MQERPKYYFPQLDSIRGLSFLAVYFFHAFHPEFGSSFLGRMSGFFYRNLVLSIDVFFILSSFLLTWLGINEYKTKGNFSFINYFIRRALRIWPLYYLLMIFSFVLLPYASSALGIPVTLPPAYYYLFFIGNFYLEGHVYFLQFLWTISVEEQFYLLWGLCLLLFQKHILPCAILLMMLSIGYTIYAISNNIPHDFNTLTYLFDFAAGIIAAFILHRGGVIVDSCKRMSKKVSFLFLLSLPVIFIILFLLTDNSASYLYPWLDLAGRYIFIVYTALFIIEQMLNERTFLKLKTQRFLVYTGKISYGLYCFHGIVLTFGVVGLQKTGISMPAIVQALLFLLVIYFIAATSYRFIEKPFLLLKDKMRRV
jgi:peptidoglycan/LPS O-acetylase OafA/YrhL